MKLLLAPTEDRKKIFRKIFKTELFQELQDRLKSESGKLSQRLEEIKNSIGQYIDGLEIEENEELLKNAKDSDILLADLIGKVDDVIASDQAEQDKIEGDIAKIEKRLTQVNVDLGKAEEVERTEVAPARGEFRFGGKEGDCSFFWQSMKQSRSGSQSSPLCASRSLWRRMNCPDTMSLTRCEKELDARRDALKAALDQREEQKNLQDKCALLLNDAKEKLEAVKDAGREEAVLEGRLQQAESRLNAVEALGGALKEWESLSKRLEEEQQKYLAAAAKAEKTAAEVSADEQGIPR